MYEQGIPGLEFDSVSDVWTIPCSLASTLPIVSFVIGGIAYGIPGNEWVVPVSTLIPPESHAFSFIAYHPQDIEKEAALHDMSVP